MLQPNILQVCEPRGSEKEAGVNCHARKAGVCVSCQGDIRAEGREARTSVCKERQGRAEREQRRLVLADPEGPY